MTAIYMLSEAKHEQMHAEHKTAKSQKKNRRGSNSDSRASETIGHRLTRGPHPHDNLLARALVEVARQYHILPLCKSSRNCLQFSVLPFMTINTIALGVPSLESDMPILPPTLIPDSPV